MARTRSDRLERIGADGAFDAIVVGGGVNGIGVFRDLALQGLRVLLVERNDFASGCSAAPSRMIHGGLRYLENGEFDLVRESLAERDALLANAPHMVRPLATVIPIGTVFSGTLNSAMTFLGLKARPARRGALPIKLGLALYDWVTRKRRRLPRHSFHSARETRARWPELTRSAMRSAVYYDAWISHPERLCTEMIIEAEAEGGGAIALNYAELVPEGDGFRLTCGRGGGSFDVTARALVNATGAWLDETASALGARTNGRMVAGTKGSHLILDNARLHDALGGHMVYFENAERRVCIVFPYLGRVLAGSTDIRVPHAGRVRCEPEELEYILGSLREIFPDIPLAEKDVVFSYAGIRPLVQSDHDFTGRISRGHDIRRLDGPVPQFCMIGGKWTTFRAFAEQTADAVLAELEQERRCGTQERPIGGGAGFPETPGALEKELIAEFAISPERASHLAELYGTGARDVQRHCAAQGSDAPLSPGTGYTGGEIGFLIRHEHVETLSDLALRRTSLAITGAITAPIIDALGAVLLAERADLGAGDIARQKADLIEELERFHGIAPETLTHASEGKTVSCA